MMSINEKQLIELKNIIYPRFNAFLKDVPQYGNVTFGFKLFDFKPGPIYKGFEECEHLYKKSEDENCKKK